MSVKKRVVLTGIYYPMAILRYFERALRRRDDIELITAGPYTSTWIPWGGGMHLPAEYSTPPDIVTSAHTTGNIPRSVLASDIAGQLPWQPDLWIQIDAGFSIADKPASGKNVIVATDPHVLNYDHQRINADIFYCMQRCYMRSGDKYLPYAFDPIWHSPYHHTEKLYDAALLGLHYQQRDSLVQALQSQGYQVKYDLGSMGQEAREIYSAATMGLNWSSLQDLTARVFELLGLGILAVVNEVPDLPEFFTDGVHLETFSSQDEAVEIVQHYAANPKEAADIALAGFTEVQGQHSWDARITQILEGREYGEA